MTLDRTTMKHWVKMFERVFAFEYKTIAQIAASWYRDYPDVFSDLKSNVKFSVVVNSDGKFVSYNPSPISYDDGGGCPTIAINVLRGKSLISTEPLAPQLSMIYRVPCWILLNKSDFTHFMYNVQFHIHDELVAAEPSMAPLSAGYIGITRRHPLTRFKEHLADACAGRGHALHRAWSSLMRAEIGHVPVFTVSGASVSLKGIYALEEKWVAERTLLPMGLNVINGGELGIRQLHEQRLLKNDRLLSADHRDAALVKLESAQSVATHYRRGHIRTLQNPSRTTWVKACWVNLEPASMAA